MFQGFNEKFDLYHPPRPYLTKIFGLPLTASAYFPGGVISS